MKASELNVTPVKKVAIKQTLLSMPVGGMTFLSYEEVSSSSLRTAISNINRDTTIPNKYKYSEKAGDKGVTVRRIK